MRRTKPRGRSWLGLGVAWVLALGACGAAPQGDGRKAPSILLSGMVLRHYPKEGPAKIASAAEVAFDRNTGVVTAETIAVDLPPEEEPGVGGVTLKAPRGQGDVGGEGAVVEGRIVATTGRGDVATTVGSVWDGEEDLLFGDEPAEVQGPGYALSGASYRFDVAEQQLALEGGVHFKADEAGEGAGAAPLDVQSPKLTVDHVRRQATFSGGVILTQGDLVVRCPALVAHYEGVSSIRKVVCEGPVRATQGGREMEARQGTFDNLERKLVLEGEPLIREGDRWIRGETMVWEVDRRVATVGKGRAEFPAADLPDGEGQKDPLGVVADTITYDVDSSTATFLGGVVATRGDMTLRGERLYVVAAEGGGVDRAWTEGGRVSVVEGDRRATSGRAQLLENGSLLVLSGAPKLRERGSSLEGDRVVFHIGEDRVEVEKPRAVFPLQELEEKR